MAEYQYLRAHLDDLRSVGRLRKALRAVRRDLDSLPHLPRGFDADLHRRFLTRHYQLVLLQALLATLGQPGKQRELGRHLRSEDFASLQEMVGPAQAEELRETISALGFAHRQAAFVHAGLQFLLTVAGVAYVYGSGHAGSWLLGSSLVLITTVWLGVDIWAYRRSRRRARALFRRLRDDLVVRLNLMQRMQAELTGY